MDRNRTVRNLIYCTGGYPGDLYSEKVFVDSELEALQKRFDHIVIVPVNNVSRDLRFIDMLPDGVEGDMSLVEDKTVHSRIRRLQYLFHPFVRWSLKTIRGEAHGLKQWMKGLYQALTAVAISRRLLKIAREHGFTPENTVLYSLWFHDSAAAEALLAETEGWRMATRAHTSDMYDERMLFRSKKVRARLLRSVGKVFSISRRGKKYLDERFPEFKDKFEWLPLGSVRIYETSGEDALSEHNYENSERPLNFITVARLDPIKRLDLIADVLTDMARRKPERRLRWIIIGDGPCLEELSDKAESIDMPNLEIVLPGRMTNEEIQEIFAFYRPDWYIMMSYSEGVPISMGEAMSYGIPVITTDVGEIRELANGECALFLPRDIDAREGAARLLPLVFDENLGREMGNAALKRWEKCFDSRRFSKRLAEELVSLDRPKKD